MPLRAQHEAAIERALMQRNQQSAEFAAQVRGGAPARQALESLHQAQLRDAAIPASVEPSMADALRPVQRARAEQESAGYVLRFAPPEVPASAGTTSHAPREPLALPGGPVGGVDPVAPQRLAN